MSLKSLGCIASDTEIQGMLQEYRFAEPDKISYEEFKKMMVSEFSPKYTPHPLNLMKARSTEDDEKVS